jgi:hypothetical protein
LSFALFVPPVVNVGKTFFSSSLTLLRNKLECLSLISSPF